MYLWAKYNTATDIRFPMVKRGVVDLAVTGDWTPATGDTKISKDGGTVANTTNNPAIVAGTGSVSWKLTVTATELQAAEVNIQIVDSATKAVEDQFLTIYTYGNASAKIQTDLSDVVRAGLTALPSAAAEAAGGLYTRGSGAGQINQPANGMVDTNPVRINGVALAASNLSTAVQTEQVFTVTNAGFSPTTTEFETATITEATASHYVGREVYFTSGALQYQRATITAYSLVSGRGHFTVGTMTDAPANNDTGIII